MKYKFIVEVDTDTYDDACHVMSQRISYDEDYGFYYRIDWEG